MTMVHAIDQQSNPFATAPGAEKNECWERLEVQDNRLWILTVALMFILGVSLLSFMFPAVFWFADERKFSAPVRAFVGFGILQLLSLIYIVQKQSSVRTLRTRLYEALSAASRNESAVLATAFLALPGNTQLKDSLSMEYRRAASSHETLSLILLDCPDAPAEFMGKIAKQLAPALGRKEALYRCSEHTLVAILPGVPLKNAESLGYLAKVLFEQISPSAGVRVVATAYPEKAESYSELKAALGVYQD